MYKSFYSLGSLFEKIKKKFVEDFPTISYFNFYDKVNAIFENSRLNKYQGTIKKGTHFIFKPKFYNFQLLTGLCEIDSSKFFTFVFLSSA